MQEYSLATARDRYTAIVREVSTSDPIQLTRRGKPVAVILSIEEYRRLTTEERPFWETYEQFRQEVNLNEMDIDPVIFDDVRDQSTGREVQL